MGSMSVRFAESVRVLAAKSSAAGLVVPGFVTPPHSRSRDRVLRRLPNGGLSVAVRTDGRPFEAVQADMIEGVVRVNDLGRLDAATLRRDLWNALAAGGLLDSEGVVVSLDPHRRRRTAAPTNGGRPTARRSA